MNTKLSSTKPKRSHRLLHILVPLILFILGCPSPMAPGPGNRFEEPMPAEEFSDAEWAYDPGITIMGEAFHLAPDSTASFLVQVDHNSYYHDVDPADAYVTVTLSTQDSQPQEVFSGGADENGLVQVSFVVPADLQEPEQTLTVIAETTAGTLRAIESVYIGEIYNVLVTTDKPVYQPGQTIHMRGLALDTNALKAAQDEPLLLTVQDPQGNRVMRQELTTSQYGIAAADFPLDSQASSGDYIITAEMGPVSSSRSVEVKPYVLPRFEVTFQSNQSFYMPGDIVTGTVDAQYFFGKPVAGGQVIIKGFATDYERFEVFELTGETDENGFYEYEFEVPDYFVGQLGNDTAKVDLEISVIDTANHAENIDESITIAEQPILVEAIPESGFLQSSLENIIYFHSTYPDGQSAQTTLSVDSDMLTGTVEIETDEFGLATVSITPTGKQDVVLSVVAVDNNQQSVNQEIVLGTSGVEDAVLMRPEKAQYQIGETLNVDIHVAGQATTAYLDIIKGQQTFGLIALPIAQGIAQASIDLDGSLLGTLELNAYVITEQGDIMWDRRLILINPAPAQVDIQTDAEVYRPGETAILDITVNHDDGPMSGALGISIVDESLFSLGAQNPGFARTYFLLDAELQEPRYEIHDFVSLRDSDSSPYDNNLDNVRGSSRLISSVPDAQQIALFGLFAEELAISDQPLATNDQTLATNNQSPTTNYQSLAWGWGNRLFLVMPLIGLAFYNGTRRRRHMLIAMVLLSLSGLFWAACAAPPSARPAADSADMAAETAEADDAGDTTATRGQAAKPRLRQYFPETLYWMPEVETDENGYAQIEVPIADSITTWRISVLASDQDGNLGSAQVGMRVFQDFFVEPDLPRFLTVGDELEMPVTIFNYLDEAQEIQLEIAEAGWFELIGDPELTVNISASEVAAVYIPIRVTDFGSHDLRIDATGNQMSDAVLRQVEILPNGQRQTAVINGKLGDEAGLHNIELPEDAIPGTGQATVKLYPGVVSQVLDGLEGMLQQPNGCFEQTSSTTYPNVLVLDYLKTTDQINPQIQLEAERFINLGYQRLLSFEVQGYPGGFSLFGGPPPQTMLTAYGLMEFTDMSEVSYVDPDLLERTASFLFERQKSNGSWKPQGMTIESGVERMGEGNLPATAYITWALADAGFGRSQPVQMAIEYIYDNLETVDDTYILALIANALVASDSFDKSILDQLIAQAQAGPDETIFWQTDLNTWLDSGSDVASIETTALVASALLRSGYRADVGQQAIDYLLSKRDSFGTFYTTQATVLSLKALLLAEEYKNEDGDVAITIQLNDGNGRDVVIDESNKDVVEQVRFTDLQAGENSLALEMEGQRGVQYQIVTEYYVPWSESETAGSQDETLRVDVTYDRTELQVNDVVNVTAEVELLVEGTAGTILIDLGVPPGFSPITADLDALVESGRVSRYERTGRQILLYVLDMPSGQPYTFDYRLRARFPIKAQTPSSTAYDYYTPDQRDTAEPQRIVVTLGTPGK